MKSLVSYYSSSSQSFLTCFSPACIVNARIEKEQSKLTHDG